MIAFKITSPTIRKKLETDSRGAIKHLFRANLIMNNTQYQLLHNQVKETIKNISDFIIAFIITHFWSKIKLTTLIKKRKLTTEESM